MPYDQFAREAQAAEEIRGRDPVKRAVVMVAVVDQPPYGVGASLQMKLMSDNAKSSQLANSLGSRPTIHRRFSQRAETGGCEEQAGSVHHLASERFLQRNC